MEQFKCLLSFLLGLVSSTLFAQEVVDYSYVKTRTYASADGSKVLEHVDYDNGLGDMLLQVELGASPGGKSIVSYMEYDNQRRLSKRWLPVAVSGNGMLGGETLKQIANELYSDAFPYQETIYELSPQGDKIKEFNPGSDMRSAGHYNKYSMLTSIAGNDSLFCKCIRSVGDELYEQESFYSPFKVMRHEDEEGNSVLEFYDANEKMILSRLQSGNKYLSTYYVYDQLGNLSYVIPPALSDDIGQYLDVEHVSNTEAFRKYVTQYRYDGFHRCIYKRLPGCEPIYYIYDKAGNMIFSQDGNQRERGEWSFSIPDRYGREALKGICKNTFDYQSEPLLGQIVCAIYYNTEEYAAAFGYKIEGIELQKPHVMDVKMYDDYRFVGCLGIPSSLRYEQPKVGYGVACSQSKNMQTGHARNILGGGAIFEAYYYDEQGRVIQKKSTTNKYEDDDFFSYDLLGNVLKYQRNHLVDGKLKMEECYTYSYDHAGRLLSEEHQLNNGRKVSLVENAYDELGRLSSTKRNGNASLMTTFAFDVRSNLTNLHTSNLFDEKLYYTEDAQGNQPRFDGNISGIEWTTGGKARGYNFEYDGFSRLLKANYLEEGTRSKHYDTSYSYNKSGNITLLIRRGLQDGGSYGFIDRLIIHHNGYRLKRVYETVADPTYAGAFNFVKGSKAEIEYEYDKNGNLVKDINKKISKIEYNLLNLPQLIIYENGNRISFSYDLNGTKRKVEYTSVSPANKHIVEYIENMIYEDGVLKQLLVDGGYVSFEEATPTYHFYLNDHLGNCRVVVDQNAQVEQVNHYYPYGGLMAESTGQEVQRRKYNGKELDRMFGLDWYDYGARWYDATLGLFVSVDPFGEVDYDLTPYGYCGGNPISRIDKDGQIWTNVGGALVGAATDYVSQVISNSIKSGEVSMDSFTNVDGRSIALSAVAGFVSSGASAIGASVGKTVMARSGSKFAGKLAKRMAEEATEFSANMISAQGNIKKASSQHAFGKLNKAASIPRHRVKSNKEIRKEMEKTSNIRKPMNQKQKRNLKRQAGRKQKVIIKKNKRIEDINRVKQVGVDVCYGTSDHYYNDN